MGLYLVFFLPSFHPSFLSVFGRGRYLYIIIRLAVSPRAVSSYGIESVTCGCSHLWSTLERHRLIIWKLWFTEKSYILMAGFGVFCSIYRILLNFSLHILEDTQASFRSSYAPRLPPCRPPHTFLVEFIDLEIIGNWTELKKRNNYRRANSNMSQGLVQDIGLSPKRSKNYWKVVRRWCNLDFDKFTQINIQYWCDWGIWLCLFGPLGFRRY